MAFVEQIVEADSSGVDALLEYTAGCQRRLVNDIQHPGMRGDGLFSGRTQAKDSADLAEIGGQQFNHVGGP